jgi:hypothetical protein
MAENNYVDRYLHRLLRVLPSDSLPLLDATLGALTNTRFCEDPTEDVNHTLAVWVQVVMQNKDTSLSLVSAHYASLMQVVCALFLWLPTV